MERDLKGHTVSTIKDTVVRRILTQERAANVFGDLVARFGFRKVAQLLVQHSLELENNKGDIIETMYLAAIKNDTNWGEMHFHFFA